MIGVILLRHQVRFRSSYWRKVSTELKVDLRSLPVSFLVAHKNLANDCMNQARIIGRPRAYKGFVRWQACAGHGVFSDFQKRASKSVFKALSEVGKNTLIDLDLLQD